MKRLRLGVAFGLLMGALLLFGVADSIADTSPTVDDVEAAYLHKFIGYIDWPAATFANEHTPIVIGVAGSDHMYELLSAIVVGRPVQNRPIEVRHLSQPQYLPELRLVFVGPDAWKDLRAWSVAAKGKAVVITTDAPNGLDKGAALAFVQIGTRVRFEASIPAAELAGVKLSARMLAVAARVVGATQ